MKCIVTMRTGLAKVVLGITAMVEKNVHVITTTATISMVEVEVAIITTIAVATKETGEAMDMEGVGVCRKDEHLTLMVVTITIMAEEEGKVAVGREAKEGVEAEAEEEEEAEGSSQEVNPQNMMHPFLLFSSLPSFILSHQMIYYVN